MVEDTMQLVHGAMRSGKRIIAEGANAAMLDLEFGTYPYVTASSTTIGGVSVGLGVPNDAIETKVGIIKAYTTRVGGGPFPTELTDNIGAHLQDVGHEFGSTTGRPRRCGWLDLNVLKYSHMLNNYSSLNLTKLDVLSGIDKLKIATSYDLPSKNKRFEGSFPADLNELENAKVNYIEMDGWKEDISNCQSFDQLPRNAQDYVKFIEEELQLKISWLGTGPKRENMFRVKNP